MTLNSSKNEPLFARKSIRNALKSWKNLKKLGKHDLAQLKIVEMKRREQSFPSTEDGYGAALRALLREAIESLKPKGEEPDCLTLEWGAYVILTEQFIKQRKAKSIQESRDIPRRTYANWQRSALDQIAHILREEELELEQTSPALTERHVPFMPPPLPSYGLIGRDQMLNNLRRRLLAGHVRSMALFALKGLPGVGKTALATALAHDPKVQAHFADGILWAGLGREPNILALLSSWGMALGIPAGEMGKLTTIEDRARAIHAVIGKRRILLVIDDAWQIEDALAFKLGGPNCAHLLTTRLKDLAWDFAEEGAKLVQELNEADSLVLLSEFVPKLVIAHPEEAKALVNVVGGLPLALILIGRYVRKALRPGQQNVLADVLAQLQQAKTRLSLSMPQSPLEKQPSLPYGVPLSLSASIEISDKALDEPARQMLRASSLFPPKPNSFLEEAALAVADKPAHTLQTLIDAGLLERSGPSRYTLHQAIADYARLKNPDPDNGSRRGASYFADFALQHSESDGYPRLDDDWQNVSHFLAWTYQNQAWTPLLDGVEGLTRMNLGIVGFMDARGHWVQVKQLLEKALEAAKALNEPQREGAILSKLGAFAFRQSHSEQAKFYLEQSLAIFSLLPSSPELTLQQTHAYEFLARLEMGRDPEAAREWIQNGLSELAGWPMQTHPIIYQKGYFNVLLAEALGRRGQYEAAIKAANTGLALLPSTPTSARIVALIVLGNVFDVLGNIEKSLAYQKEGLQMAEALGDLRRMANLCNNVAINQRQKGHLSAAMASNQKALQIYQQIGDHHAVGRAYTNLAKIYLIRAEDEHALRCLSIALKIAKEHKIIRLEAFAKTNLADLQIRQKQLTKAASNLSQAKEICQQLKLVDLLPAVFYWQAEIACLSKELNKARKMVDTSLTVAKKGSVLEGIAYSIKGKILDAQQHFNEAEDAHRASLTRLEKQYPYALATSQFAFGQHFVMRDGHLSKTAKLWLENALATFERLGAKREIGQINSLLNTRRNDP